MSDRDIDAEFDAIVAHWDDDASTPPKPRTVQDITAAYAALSRPEVDEPPPSDEPPTGTDLGPDGAAAPVDEPPSTPAPAPEPELTSESAESVSDSEGWRHATSRFDEDDDHFEPPPVQLPPGEDLGYWGAFLGLIGGPLLLLWVAVAKPFYGGWWTLGAILLFFGGFGLLVMRQPKDRDPLDGDDGARV